MLASFSHQIRPILIIGCSDLHYAEVFYVYLSSLIHDSILIKQAITTLPQHHLFLFIVVCETHEVSYLTFEPHSQKLGQFKTFAKNILVPSSYLLSSALKRFAIGETSFEKGLSKEVTHYVRH